MDLYKPGFVFLMFFLKSIGPFLFGPFGVHLVFLFLDFSSEVLASWFIGGICYIQSTAPSGG